MEYLFHYKYDLFCKSNWSSILRYNMRALYISCIRAFIDTKYSSSSIFRWWHSWRSLTARPCVQLDLQNNNKWKWSSVMYWYHRMHSNSTNFVARWVIVRSYLIFSDIDLVLFHDWESITHYFSNIFFVSCTSSQYRIYPLSFLRARYRRFKILIWYIQDLSISKSMGYPWIQ